MTCARSPSSSWPRLMTASRRSNVPSRMSGAMVTRCLLLLRSAPWCVAGACSTLAIAAAACGGERAAEPGPDAPRTSDGVASEGHASEAGPGAPTGQLDEASARLLIAGRLRAVGLRVVADVPLGAGGVEVTLDGFDPARRIGYEYVAADERGHDLEDAERERLAGVAGTRVLVIDSGDAEAVESAVERFLAAGAGPSPAAEDGADSGDKMDAQRARAGPGPQDG